MSDLTAKSDRVLAAVHQHRDAVAALNTKRRTPGERERAEAARLEFRDALFEFVYAAHRTPLDRDGRPLED